MAKPKVYDWPAASVAAVAALQTTTGAGFLILNGTLVDKSTSITGLNYAVFPGICRTVSLTSTGNLGGVNFTIAGTLKGLNVTETRVGPNNNTVETAQFYDTVTSVSVNAAVGTAVSVGTGTTGYTQWFSHNYHATGQPNTTIAVTVGTTTINYSFQTTYDNAEIDELVDIFEPLDGTLFPVDMVMATGSLIANYNWPAMFSRIFVNSSTNTGSFQAVFLQQGIT